MLRNLAASRHYMDFSKVNRDTKNFIVLRHDVEFSIERAHKMAILESMLGIRSSYLFQIRNDAYNLFSAGNIQTVRNIHEIGHYIGLHVHLGMLESRDQLQDYIIQDVEIMEKMLGIPIDRFSYHRPSKEILTLGLKIDGLINTYDDLYFKFQEKDWSELTIKYIADSRHQWKYGYPDKKILKKQSKIQLLIHPDEWTTAGYTSNTNFRMLQHEKRMEFNNTLKSECNHFEQDIQISGE
ncbi:hypothetical protein [Paenibacillus mendelii]|uniref:IrrE N-terminal-like domain-containing protein n=1 Tax=Paenibacillus mendelii TaxID=206163 RepID=A0ABV6J925_9BACL|nr:hypothetical protein [Paenibacillus mendelii]MCQ6559711.1 hypothetical protein [Paenibacillus mendelii]